MRQDPVSLVLLISHNLKALDTIIGQQSTNLFTVSQIWVPGAYRFAMYTRFVYRSSAIFITSNQRSMRFLILTTGLPFDLNGIQRDLSYGKNLSPGHQHVGQTFLPPVSDICQSARHIARGE